MSIPTELWRKQRLQELVDSLPDGNAGLGMMLKLKSGNYISQLLTGHRPITEKFVNKVQALPGYKTWFVRDHVPEQLQTVNTDIDAAVDLIAVALRSLSEKKRGLVLGALALYVSDPLQEADSREFVVGALGGAIPSTGLHKRSA